MGRAGWVSKALGWGRMATSARQGCWSKQCVRDMESPQSGSGEPGTVHAGHGVTPVWQWGAQHGP